MGSVFKILNLLFVLSPTELAAWIASGPPVSVQSWVFRSQTYLSDFMLVLLICLVLFDQLRGRQFRASSDTKHSCFCSGL